MSHTPRLLPVILAGIALMSAVLPARAAEDRTVVAEWNRLLQSNIPTTAAIGSPRYYAMLHIAMYDAVAAIDGSYEPYRVRLSASPAASQTAAAAQAAHDVLVALLPAAQPVFDAALANRLATIPNGPRTAGSTVGRKVAQGILEWRANDGYATTVPPYVLPLLPGLWQPTPPGFLAAALPQFGEVEPFGLLTPFQYLPDPPPTLTSEEYTQNFIEVKELGGVISTTRTAEQTQTARLHASVGNSTTLWAMWNNVARDVSQKRRLSLVRTARLYALLNASIHDGLQTSHSSKFVYGLWRPVTAIQRADEDLNPLTIADPTWLPLITTPPYPSHSSNMACVGASAARALARVFRSDAASFSVTWVGIPPNLDVTRSYTSFWQLADSQALARLYGGIHYTFELVDSQESCVQVADYIYENFARPRTQN